MYKVENAVNRELDQEDEDIPLVEFGIDVARFGDDESVIYSRVGNRYVEELNLKKNDTVELANKSVRIALDKYPDKTHYIFNVDDSGVGGGVTDNINRLVREKIFGSKTVTVNPVNNGGRVRDKKQYGSVTSEMWGYVRDNIEEMCLPDNKDLTGQLSVRKFTMDTKARILLESKKQMKQRKISSPDNADAFVLSNTSLIYQLDVLSTMSTIQQSTREDIQNLVDDYHKSSLKDRLKSMKRNKNKR